MTMLPPGMRHPAVQELNSAPNAPAPGQQLQAMQQMQNVTAQNESSAAAGNAQRIMQYAKEMSSNASTAEEKAQQMKIGAKSGVIMNAGGGGANLALQQDPNFQETAKYLGFL